MKLHNEARKLDQSAGMRVVEATIKASPKLFNFFSDQVYANKPLAIMRELVANGIDSHVMNGTSDRRVEVWLANDLDPTCRIRDYGLGMSEEFLIGDPDKGIASKFMAYSDGSTKDSSNAAIGGFGIGSKSPFSYVDQYTIKSVQDGVLGLYTMFKQEDGTPAIGQLYTETTDEPNGVEISFPVASDDMESFREAAQQALQYFYPIPIVHGIELKEPAYSYRSSRWALNEKAGPLGVIMGGVRYPVTTANLDHTLRQDPKVAPLLDYGIDLILPIGAAGVALSREALSYTGDTSKNIGDALREVTDDVIATFKNMFDGVDEIWEARSALFKVIGDDIYKRDARAKLLAGNAFYRGEKLEASFRTKGFNAWSIPAAGHRGKGRGNRVGPAKWDDISLLYDITPGRIGTVIVDDLPIKPSSRATTRIKDWVETNSNYSETLVIRVPTYRQGKDIDNSDRAEIQVMLDALGNPKNVIYASDTPMPVRVTKTSTGVRPRVRMWKFNGGRDGYTNQLLRNLTPSYSKKEAITEILYKDQPADGILVVMSKFDLPSEYWDWINSGLINHDELLFVNESDASKLPHFQRVADAFAERLQEAIEDDPLLPARLALRFNNELSDGFNYVEKFIKHGAITLTPAQEKRPFGRIAALWETYLRPLTSEQIKLRPFITAALPPKIDPKKLNASFLSEQKEAIFLLNVCDPFDQVQTSLLSKIL